MCLVIMYNSMVQSDSEHCDWNDAVVVSSDSDEEFKDFKVVSNPQVGSVCSGAMSLQSVQYIPIKAQAQ